MKRLPLCIGIVLAPFLLYATLEVWARWQSERIRSEFRSVGGVGWAGAPQLLHVDKRSDAEMLAVIEIMMRHQIPRALHFGEGAKISPSSMTLLGRMHWLQRLEFRETELTDEELKYLLTLPNLEYLGLAETLVTDNSIQFLREIKSLREVRVGGSGITAAGLQELIESVPRLQTAEMFERLAKHRRVFGIDWVDERAQPVFERLIQLRQPTHRLVLGGKRMSDRSLQHVAKMTWLSELNLSQAPFTDSGFRMLANLQRLEKVSIMGTNITDDGLQALAGLPALKEVRVYVNPITPDGVAALMKATPSLQNPEMEEYVEFLREVEAKRANEASSTGK